MITWQLKSFGALDVPELYRIMRLRQEVFVVEQNCAFVDADNKDEYCHHLSGYLNGQLIAYARIVPPGVSYDEPSIGRIVTAPAFRRGGYGRSLMAEALKLIRELYGPSLIRIEAQLYLKEFYQSYGFITQSEPYILDDILHIVMVAPVTSVA